MLFIFDIENFPNEKLRGASTRFQTSYRRRRFRDNPEHTYFEDLDSPIQARMKQYRIQIEKKEK